MLRSVQCENNSNCNGWRRDWFNLAVRYSVSLLSYYDTPKEAVPVGAVKR